MRDYRHRIVIETYDQFGKLVWTRELGERPVLIFEANGEFRVDWHGRGEKNVLHSFLPETFVSGSFYLVAVPGTIEDNTIFSNGS